jgi:succinate-acetate transporter protein
MTEETRYTASSAPASPVPLAPAVANPAALGLAGFALTTFVLSAHNAGWANDLTWVGLAFFYGGLAQFMAGMWEFRANNTFGATAFTTYGAFWMSLATFVVLVLAGKVPAGQIAGDEGWFLLAFAVFNTYMLILSTRVSVAVFLVFLTLEVTEIVLFIGAFAGSTGLIQIGGYVGIITAIVAWYTSFATVANNMGTAGVMWVGNPLWVPGTPMARAPRVAPQ